MFVDTLCYLVAILYLFSQSLSSVRRCEGQLLNVTFSFLSARCIRWPGFALIRLPCCCIIDAVLLALLCCTRFMRTLLTDCSASFQLFLREFDILGLRMQLIHWSLNYHGVERPNLQGVSFRARFKCGMTFLTLCLASERWMGSRVQSAVSCFPKLRVLRFSVAQVLMGLRKKFINNFVFPARACAASFNNNNNTHFYFFFKLPKNKFMIGI